MRFDFIDSNRRQGFCDLEDCGNLIVLTQLKDNPAMTVTNACEYIATQYAEAHGKDLEKLRVIECYDRRSYSEAAASKKEKLPLYSLVNFTAGNRWGKPHLTTPVRKYLPTHEAREMIAAARQAGQGEAADNG